MVTFHDKRLQECSAVGEKGVSLHGTRLRTKGKNPKMDAVPGDLPYKRKNFPVFEEELSSRKALLVYNTPAFFTKA